MKDVLKKLFSKEAPVTITAAVRRRIAPGRYELIDDSGRVFQADTNLILSPQQRGVVQGGRVISLVGRRQAIRTYEV